MYILVSTISLIIDASKEFCLWLFITMNLCGCVSAILFPLLMSDGVLGQHSSLFISLNALCAMAEMYAKRLKAGKPVDEVILHAGGVHGGAKQEQMELLNCWRVAEWDIAWGNMHLAQVSRLFLPGRPSERAPPPKISGQGCRM